MPLGKLIVLDGPEGAGKTTVWNGLKAELPDDKYLFSREPGGTAFGERLREMLLNPDFHMEDETEFLLFWAARVEHGAKIIRPALIKGINVILDRFDSSTFAIQLWGRENYSWRVIFTELRNFVCEDITPDLYIHLELGVEEARLRLDGRTANNHFDNEPPEFHERVNVGYRRFFEDHPNRKVNGNRTPPVVLADVKKIVLDLCA